jgi:inner membrane protein
VKLRHSYFLKKGVKQLNGTAHLTIGAATGFVIGNTLQEDLPTSLLFVGLGAISGLLPDIDIDGKLSKRITLSSKIIRTVAQTIGILLIIYSYLQGTSVEKWYGMGVGFVIMVLSTYITQRRMLTLTGIGVIFGGVSLDENWLWLLGIYIFIASLIPHRSYTHSLIGVLFFGVIAMGLEESLKIQGVFMTCLLGYISHLIIDMKLLPFNKRGVKLLLPLSSKEF